MARETPSNGARDPRVRIEPYRLSPGLEALALQIARLSRVWGGLRADIAEMAAEEMATHLRHGVPADEVPARMGRPAEIAKRLRRERLGGWTVLLRMVSGWKSALATTVLLAFLLYIGALVWFHTARPRITRNFVAEINAANAALPGPRGAATYLKALAALPDLADPLRQKGLSEVMPDDPRWADVLDYLNTAREPLSQVRAAAKLPVLGMTLNDGTEHLWSIDRAGRALTPSTPTSNPPTVEILLPQLGLMRYFARMLAADALAAAEAKDSARCAASLESLSGLSRHSGEYPFLICDLVAIAIDALQSERIGRILRDYPDLLNDEQLMSLARAVGARRVGPDAVRFDGERMMVEDFLQRAFTDNGRGDGRLCAAGLRAWGFMMSSAGAAGGRPNSLSVDEWVLGPVIAFTSSSRKEMLAEWDRHMSRAEQVKRTPPWRRASGGSRGSVDLMVEAARGEAGADRSLQLLSSILPAPGSAIARADESTESRDGTLVAIALERHRLATGVYPATLEELVPRFLDAVPIDRMDGKPLRYLRMPSGQPVLYSIGGDHDDDGGRPPRGPNTNESARRARAGPGLAPADGDYVLWPAPIEVRPEPPN